MVLGNQVAKRVCIGRGGNDSWRWCACRRRYGSCPSSCAAGIAQAVADQGFQRVHGLGRVQVQHQAVLVGCDRRQSKDLGAGFLLEVDHQANHAGGELSHADAGDIGIVCADLGHQLLEGRVQIQAFDVHCQARRTGNKHGLGRQRNIGFQRDARIVGGGPDAYGHDGGTLRNMLAAQQQNHAACLQQVAT